jgi:hypothetical protein
MKYIMFAKKLGSMTHHIPIIFPDVCVHLHIAEVMSVLPEMKGYKPVSAGQITLPLEVIGRKFSLVVNGGSETLKLESRSIDAEIIKMYEYGSAYQ